MRDIVKAIQKEIEILSSDPKNLKDYSKFHKDSRKHIHLTSPVVRKVSSKFFRKIESREKERVFQFCERLLEKHSSSYRKIAFDWAFKMRKQYQKEDFKLFGRWLQKYVDSWGSCDDFCLHAFGAFMFQFPKFLKETERWAESEDRWLRRASAVVLIYSLRRKTHCYQTFRIANSLLSNKEDLVQKGYGWMLKEASVHFPDEVYKYVFMHRKEIPRTALRYAIEKMPIEMKAKILQI